MRPAVEFIGFLGLSVAAHLAFWQGTSGGVPGSAGDDGAASVTISGGTPALQALVAEWDRPPEPAAPSPAMMAPPDPAASAPDLAARAPDAAPMARPAAPLAPDVLAALPEIDSTTPPAPPSQLAPRESPRPKPRQQAQQPKPARPAAQASAAAPQQKAAGNGGGVVAGRSGDSGASADPAKPDARQIARWGGAIRARVERRKRYPGGMTGTGKTGLWLKVATSGQLQGVGITRSSGATGFDEAAISAVRRAALPRAPKGIAAGVYRFTLTVSFTK